MIRVMVVVIMLVVTLSACSSTSTDDGPGTWAGEFAVGFACGVGTSVLIRANADFRFTPLC